MFLWFEPDSKYVAVVTAKGKHSSTRGLDPQVFWQIQLIHGSICEMPLQHLADREAEHPMVKPSPHRHVSARLSIGQSLGSQLVAAVLGVLLCVLVPYAAASAAIAEYRFDASLDAGPLQGTTFPGTFSFDTGNETGVGMESQPLASLDFTLLGTHFSRSDIDQGGQVILDDGAVSYFTAAFFRVTPAPVSDIAFGFGGPGEIGYIVPPEMFGSGRYEIFAVPVPEPPVSWLLTAGLAAMVFVRGASRKRRNHIRRAFAG